jgi:predicted Zn-ribbon and HTH transcriptional regulator
MAKPFPNNYRCTNCNYSTYIDRDVSFREPPRCPKCGSVLIEKKKDELEDLE